MEKVKQKPPADNSKKAQEKLDHELENTFPASDPPSTTQPASQKAKAAESKHPK